MGVYGGKGKKGSGLSELLPAAIVYFVVTFALGGVVAHVEIARPHELERRLCFQKG